MVLYLFLFLLLQGVMCLPDGGGSKESRVEKARKSCEEAVWRRELIAYHLRVLDHLLLCVCYLPWPPAAEVPF